MTDDGGELEIWGDGEQTRSFLYIEECIEGTVRLMRSDCQGPINIGSDELISINGLAAMAANIAGKNVRPRHVRGPLGVRGRNSNNVMIQEKLEWRPNQPLRAGLAKTYDWINLQVRYSKNSPA